MSQKTKREPMKPVKAWAVVSERGAMLGNAAASVDGGRVLAYRAEYQAKEAAAEEPAGCRVVRVEIREVPR